MLVGWFEETFHLNNSQISEPVKNPSQAINLLSQTLLEKRQTIPQQYEGQFNISVNANDLRYRMGPRSQILDSRWFTLWLSWRKRFQQRLHLLITSPTQLPFLEGSSSARKGTLCPLPVKAILASKEHTLAVGPHSISTGTGKSQGIGKWRK